MTFSKGNCKLTPLIFGFMQFIVLGNVRRIKLGRLSSDSLAEDIEILFSARRKDFKSLEVTKTFCEDLDLIDAWRVLHPDLSRFMWRQRRPEVHCRLDFFFFLLIRALFVTSMKLISYQDIKRIIR